MFWGTLTVPPPPIYLFCVCRRFYFIKKHFYFIKHFIFMSLWRIILPRGREHISVRHAETVGGSVKPISKLVRCVFTLSQKLWILSFLFPYHLNHTRALLTLKSILYISKKSNPMNLHCVTLRSGLLLIERNVSPCGQPNVELYTGLF